MLRDETKALLEFADKHNCFKGCDGCIGESENGCIHPDHPLLNKPVKQDIFPANEANANV